MSRAKMAAATLTAVLVVALAGCFGPKVQTIEPGLTYVDRVGGNGAVVAKGDFVIVHTTGWLMENGADGKLAKGKQLSSAAGDTITIRIGSNAAIPGLEKGVLGMKIGGTRELTVAPEHAFGADGRPPLVPANATIYFEVKALDIVKVDIQVQQEGTGAVAAVGDQIAVHYTGYLWENNALGKKFDSSLDRGEPIRFRLGANMVIPGWDAAFEGMKVGTKARIIIPPMLAYGRQGTPDGTIPPTSVLAFDVELVEIAGK